jgi:hypothetical protein
LALSNDFAESAFRPELPSRLLMPLEVQAYKQPMHPNFTLRRLADTVQPDESEVQAVRDRFGAVWMSLARAFPRSRFVPIGSHSRGTAIAVHSHLDFLVLLPSDWARRGAYWVSPVTIIHRMIESMMQLGLALEVRRDGRGVALNFRRGTFAVDVMPGFLVRVSDSHPVYLVPGDDNRWIEVTPERHNAFFSRSNAECGAKLQAISRLVRAWRFACCPPLEISSLYVDMMLATSDIASGVKSYGQSLSDFFKALVERELRALSDPAGVSGVIVASSSNAALDRLYDAAKAAAAHAQAALDAQLRGDNAEANHQWETIFRRRISRRQRHAMGG